jgi:hypothetical protein
LPVYPDPPELILMVIIIAATVIAIKILLDLSSKHHRRRYTKIVRFDFTIGILLGLSLPWVEKIGVTAAALTAILLLVLSVLMLLESKAISIWRVKPIRRERIRDWFLNFSVITGVVGIVTTLLSIVVPPFLKLTLGFMVPLAFDSVSVLSALLEFTLPSTPYNLIFALVFQLLKGKDNNPARTEISQDDIEEIAHGTAHTGFEVQDAIQSLLEQGLAEKTNGRFRVDSDGMKLLRLSWEEVSGGLEIQAKHIETEIASLSVTQQADSARRLEKLNHLSESISDLNDECGLMVDRDWIANSRQRLKTIRDGLYDQSLNVG